MMGSKSVSMIMVDSKLKNSLIPIEENYVDYMRERSQVSNNNRSMLKSYKNSVQLKVLTESDLTDNSEDSQNIFSEEEYYDSRPISQQNKNY